MGGGGARADTLYLRSTSRALHTRCMYVAPRHYIRSHHMLSDIVSVPRACLPASAMQLAPAKAMCRLPLHAFMPPLPAGKHARMAHCPPARSEGLLAPAGATTLLHNGYTHRDLDTIADTPASAFKALLFASISFLGCPGPPPLKLARWPPPLLLPPPCCCSPATPSCPAVTEAAAASSSALAALPHCGKLSECPLLPPLPLLPRPLPAGSEPVPEVESWESTLSSLCARLERSSWCAGAGGEALSSGAAVPPLAAGGGEATVAASLIRGDAVRDKLEDNCLRLIAANCEPAVGSKAGSKAAERGFVCPFGKAAPCGAQHRRTQSLQ